MLQKTAEEKDDNNVSVEELRWLKLKSKNNEKQIQERQNNAISSFFPKCNCKELKWNHSSEM